MARTRRPIPSHNLKRTRDGEVKRRNIVWRWRRLFYLVALVMIVGIAGVGFVLSQVELPDAPEIADQTTFICTSEVRPGQCNENTAIAELHGEEDRVNVGLEQVPDVVINAVISAEDRDFFDHRGVDPIGIARAAYTDIRGNSASRQGGSTITQQYVKNVYLSDERTLTRKIREAVMAVKLEQELSKEEILEAYLNTIYFGRGAYGIQAAAQAYFDRDVSELNLPEAALLAGLIRSPHRAEPYREPEEARRRRRTVLDAMLEEGYITRDERDAADDWPFDSFHHLVHWESTDSVEVRADARLIGADYFVEYVRSQLADRYGDAAVFGGGLRVYTTLDLDLQDKARRAVTETLDQDGDPAGALVALDDQGQVKAMMGGTDFSTDKVNLAVGADGGGSGRQPGSTFKAFAVAEAVRQGYSLESLVRSPSTEVFPDANAGADWTVRGGCCGGTATIIEATARSSNTAFANLMLDLGPDAVVDMAQELGVESPFENVVPSLILGTGAVSVLDMATAYSTFANQGTRIDARVITRVERADGTLVEEFTATRTPVLTVDEAAKVTHALEGVIDGGTGTVADIGRPAAGKTGTTQNNWDAWFVGYTPRLTAAVWMGYPEGSIEMTSVHGQTVQGGNFPAIMWQRFMASALEGTDVEEFPDPGDLDEGDPLDADLGIGAAPPPTTPYVPPVTAGPDASTPTTTPDTTPSTEPTPTTAPTDGGGDGGGGGGGDPGTG